jgi:hypothetical protein
VLQFELKTDKQPGKFRQYFREGRIKFYLLNFDSNCADRRGGRWRRVFLPARCALGGRVATPAPGCASLRTDKPHFATFQNIARYFTGR